MKGYLSNEANIIGLESRTSSPLTIPRDKNFATQELKTFSPAEKVQDMLEV